MNLRSYAKTKRPSGTRVPHRRRAEKEWPPVEEDEAEDGKNEREDRESKGRKENDNRRTGPLQSSSKDSWETFVERHALFVVCIRIRRSPDRWPGKKVKQRSTMNEIGYRTNLPYLLLASTGIVYRWIFFERQLKFHGDGALIIGI